MGRSLQFPSKSKRSRVIRLQAARRRWQEETKAMKLAATKPSEGDVEAEIYLSGHEVNADDARKISTTVTVGSDSDPLSFWGTECHKNVSPIPDFIIPDLKQEPCSENAQDDAESDKNLANVAVKMEVESHDDTEPPQPRSFNKQCRICLDQCDKRTLRSLGPVKDPFDQLQAIMLPYIHQCFGRENANHFDVNNAPDKICGTCLHDLKIAAVFITKAIETEVVLRREFHNETQQKIPAGTKPGPLIGGRKQNGVTGSTQQLDTGVSLGNTVTAPALKCYSRKSSARKGLVKRETSSSCLDEGSPGLQNLLTNDWVKCVCSNGVTTPIIPHDEGPIALGDLSTKDQAETQSSLPMEDNQAPQSSLPVEDNQAQETDQPTIAVDSTSKNDDDVISNVVNPGGVGELCEHCGEILTVNRSRHYRKSVQCNKAAPTCRDCGRKFRDNATYIRHLLVHSSELLFKCHLCPMKYKHKPNLKRHVKLHAEGNANICDACGKSFSTRHYMMVHKRIHVDPSLAINCEYCAEKLENQQQLDHHIEDKHMDEYIEDQFPKGQFLRVILQCRFCVKRFFDPARHLRHERTHSFSKRRARARNANKTYVELNEQKKGTTKRGMSGRRKQDDGVSFGCEDEVTEA